SAAQPVESKPEPHPGSPHIPRHRSPAHPTRLYHPPPEVLVRYEHSHGTPGTKEVLSSRLPKYALPPPLSAKGRGVKTGHTDRHTSILVAIPGVCDGWGGKASFTQFVA